MEDRLIKYSVDKEFEIEISKDRKSFEQNFDERYKVLESNIKLTEQIKKIAKTENSNENIIIWNIFGFLNIIQYDLTSVGYNLVFEKKPWQKVYYARQVSLIIYEALQDIPEILGKYYKHLFDGIEEAKPYLEILKDYKKDFELFKKNNNQFFQKIRMNTSAHRDQDIDKQLEVIKNINPYRIIRLMFDFEKILRKITDHIQKYLVFSIKLKK